MAPRWDRATRSQAELARVVRCGPDAGCFECSPPVDYFLDPYQTHMLHYDGLRHLYKEIQAGRNETKCLNTSNHILVHLI